mmetsp:Transcript_8982/g.20071  ORF Transcript_8982/g.20071 Transcript_8982/m.20071 type:complete len:85 (-) Transcript_8982:367-621(-)
MLWSRIASGSHSDQPHGNHVLVNHSPNRALWPSQPRPLCKRQIDDVRGLGITCDALPSRVAQASALDAHTVLLTPASASEVGRG